MTPLVLIPCMMCDAQLFQPQIAALSGARDLVFATIHHVVSVVGLAAQVLANAPPRFAFAGLSMGGIVAMEMLRQAPDRIDRIALMDGPKRAEILNLCMNLTLALGPYAFLRQSRALMDRPDQSETLRSADLPALVLCGHDDALCPVQRHELMTSLIPDAHLEIIDDAGHLPILEQPKITNAAVQRWLEA